MHPTPPRPPATPFAAPPGRLLAPLLGRWLAAWLAALLLLGAAPARAGEVQVAVAANFSAPMQRLAADFERATGHRARLSFGASGRFYAQIVSGAPFELLLSADQQVPERLVAEGHALADTRRTYATGRLALWSANATLVDARGEVLRSGRFRHLALANPKLAPYGAAAEQVIDRLGLADALRERRVVAENIAQAHQFVASGNAELGFVAWSQVVGPDGRAASGSAWLVPDTMHAPIRQDLVLLRAGAHSAAARALLDYLKGDAARAVIRGFGYSP